MTYFGLKFLLGSTPSCDFGRSRTCPMEALTMNFESRYFWIVFTFVGDSTTTSDFVTARLPPTAKVKTIQRSEEHTSELQSRLHLVCRLLLEKKKTYITLGPTQR